MSNCTLLKCRKQADPCALALAKADQAMQTAAVAMKFAQRRPKIPPLITTGGLYVDCGKLGVLTGDGLTHDEDTGALTVVVKDGGGIALDDCGLYIDNNTLASKDSVDAVAQDLADLEEKHDTDVATINKSVSSLASDLAAEAEARTTADTALSDRLTTAESDIDTLEECCSTSTTAISNLETKHDTDVATINKSISSLESDLATEAETRAATDTTLSDRLTTAEADIDKLEECCSTNTTAISTLEEKHDADIQTLTDAVTLGSTQEPTSSSGAYRILLTNTAGATTTLSNVSAKYSTSISANPSTSTITATQFDGNASTASKWQTARLFSISDASGTNTGTTTSVDGSKAVTLKMPATIEANTTGTAATAESDVNGNSLTSYLQSVAVDGTTVTFTRGDGTTTAISTQDLNTDTLVQQTVTTANSNYPLLFTSTANQTSTSTSTARFGTKIYANPSTGTVTATKFSGAVDGTATSATNDANGNAITGYIKSLTVSGLTITGTYGDGSTFSFALNDAGTM